MTVVKNRGPLAVTTSSPVVSGADPWGASFPGLLEMMTLPAMPDGRAREGSTLLVFAADGVFKGCLNDRDNGLVAWASAGTVQEVLEALERGLQADTLEWRAQKPMARRKGSR
jgi:hypothetical protein